MTHSAYDVNLVEDDPSYSYTAPEQHWDSLVYAARPDPTLPAPRARYMWLPATPSSTTGIFSFALQMSSTSVQVDETLASSTGVTTAKHVDTELVFWRRHDDQPVIADYTKDDPAECMTALEKLDESHRVHVQDLRGRQPQFTLDRHGFQYVQHDMPGLDGVADDEHVKASIIPQTEQLVQQMIGAKRTITFTHRVRCFATDEALLADNRAPAHSVHSDFTPTGALRLLESIVPEAAERERLLTGRVRIINVWRPLKTVRRDPLAVCDWSSLDWRNDRIANRLVTGKGWHELGKYAFHPEQRWYYLSGQQPNEALVFQQFDSDQEQQGGMTLPHTAFVDPESAAGPARESIEIKMFAF